MLVVVHEGVSNAVPVRVSPEVEVTVDVASSVWVMVSVPVADLSLLDVALPVGSGVGVATSVAVTDEVHASLTDTVPDVDSLTTRDIVIVATERDTENDDDGLPESDEDKLFDIVSVTVGEQDGKRERDTLKLRSDERDREVDNDTEADVADVEEALCVCKKSIDTVFVAAREGVTLSARTPTVAVIVGKTVWVTLRVF